MTTAYSFEQIEAYLRSLGPLYLLGLVGRPDNLFIAKFEAAQSGKEALINWNLANAGGYGFPERINSQGVAEKGYLRSTITDLYRAVLYKFPETDLQTVYQYLYELIIEDHVYSFVCSDIHKRVYMTGVGKIIYLYKPYRADLDEYGVDCSKLLTTQMNIQYHSTIQQMAHLITIPNADTCPKPAV